MSDHEDLIERYVASFEKLDDMIALEGMDSVASSLAIEKPDEWGQFAWRPVKASTPRSALDEIYSRLPARFPPLYEALVLSYRWAQVDLGSYRLLPNPPGPGLQGLFGHISGDPGLWEALIPAGLIQFGRGPEPDYDPVCFDTKARKQNSDYRIVKVDHEEILCNYRVKVVAEVAPSFRHLVLETIEKAERRNTGT
jgi:hypothetical protein